LASVDPFTPAELARLNASVTQHGFRILYATGQCDDPLLRTVIAAPDVAAATANLPVNLVPPVDDKPFFFDNSRLRSMFHSEFWNRTRVQGALLILMGLFGVVTVFSAVFILVPLAIRSVRDWATGKLPGLRTTLYFALIGIAFMNIEIAQMQRLTVLLGHPVYSLTVALFSILVASGIGSFCTANVDAGNLFSAGRVRFMALVATLIALGAVSPWAVESFQGSSTPLRIAVALGLTFPAGFFMGMAFPLGMKWAARADASYTAWLWGVNGATSVCASVLTMIISMVAGISAAWWCGTIIYLAAGTLLITGTAIAADKSNQSGEAGSMDPRLEQGLAA
jgi:hypothetical protein